MLARPTELFDCVRDEIATDGVRGRMPNERCLVTPKISIERADDEPAQRRPRGIAEVASYGERSGGGVRLVVVDGWKVDREAG